MHLIAPFQQCLQHGSCTVNLRLDCFGIFVLCFCNLCGGFFFAEMSGGHFPVGTFQIRAQVTDPILEIFVQECFFGGGFFIMELFEISILGRDGTSAGGFQMIQALVDCDLAEPGFFIGTIKTGEIFVGGKKNILCQVLGVKRIAHRFQTNGKY